MKYLYLISLLINLMATITHYMNNSPINIHNIYKYLISLFKIKVIPSFEVEIKYDEINFIFTHATIRYNIYTKMWKSIINNMLKAFSTKKIGIYAPNVEFTAHITKGKHLWDSLYEVPNTDCTCWFIHPDIVAKLKNIQYHQLSNYGWGIDIIFIEQCKKYNLVAARDYDLMVYQPQYTGYNIEIASIQMKELIDYYNKFY